jgi:hypothetical protein
MLPQILSGSLCKIWVSLSGHGMLVMFDVTPCGEGAHHDQAAS